MKSSNITFLPASGPSCCGIWRFCTPQCTFCVIFSPVFQSCAFLQCHFDLLKADMFENACAQNLNCATQQKSIKQALICPCIDCTFFWCRAVLNNICQQSSPTDSHVINLIIPRTHIRARVCTCKIYKSGITQLSSMIPSKHCGYKNNIILVGNATFLEFHILKMLDLLRSTMQ